ncbi:MAG: hypothetical protein H0Z24_06200 [Thermosipho sp. (in: Bacteria)]|nr:hypothetical protein [Thermosipho sp. (in: thermotogales)]
MIPLTLNSFTVPLEINSFTLPYTVWEKLNYFLEEASLTIPSTPVYIYEASNLYEFYELTGMPYDIGGVYFDFTIILQPIHILKRKGVYEKVLLHELLHWILYGLDEKYQEGLIYWWLKEYERKEVDDFLSAFDGNLPNFIISHWIE